MALNVVNAFNIFVDSETSFNKADDFQIHCSSNNLLCEGDQYFRISVSSFNMYKNFYNVNEYNNEFKVSLDGYGGDWDSAKIAEGDYKDVADIATALQTAGLAEAQALPQDST